MSTSIAHFNARASGSTNVVPFDYRANMSTSMVHFDARASKSGDGVSSDGRASGFNGSSLIYITTANEFGGGIPFDAKVNRSSWCFLWCFGECV